MNAEELLNEFENTILKLTTQAHEDLKANAKKSNRAAKTRVRKNLNEIKKLITPFKKKTLS
jgi:hypothetical protein